MRITVLRATGNAIRKRSGLTVLMLEQATLQARTRLSFCMDGLSLRDELVMRSLVRILDHRTQHQWFYSPNNADLRVVGDMVAVAVAADAPPSANPTGQVLMVGAIRKNDGPFLSLPLNSTALERMLNHLGEHISEARLTDAVAISQTESSDEFRLRKWPSSAMLTGPERMKIATLVMARSMTLEALAQRAGVAQEICMNFLRELQAGGFLMVTNNAIRSAPHELAASSTKVKIASSLLSRIRSRLGLSA
ncbi:hypothetical protein [Actimicrobium antarcticum]|uniref:HTH crp-type domain-containing protein n=1 Tax=Actimicrobium antarcticum TaxID=1051899 RepID=A0ABP7SKQ1_9BURK